MSASNSIKATPIYFSGLNGIRAIAAIAVVISHTTLALKEFNLNPFIFGTLEDGKPSGISLSGYGVSIFFVLSGFLITYLLQAEKLVQPIDIKKFYLRRILRIWPLYYLYLAIVIIVLLVTGFKIQNNLLMLYVFYSSNVPLILGVGLPLLGHYWSLGVEEQFYLFWPWFNQKVNKFIEPTIIACIAVIMTAKILLHFLYPGSIIETAIHISRFHCMMMGALGALLYKRNHRLFLKIADNKISQAICWMVIVLLAVNRFHLASIIDNEIVAVVGLVLIIGQINTKNRIVNLEKNVFDYLGKISYGIYVIHPLIIFFLSKLLADTTMHTTLKYGIVYSTVLAATIITAHFSYYYFERYFMNLKKKFVVIESASEKSAGAAVMATA